MRFVLDEYVDELEHRVDILEQALPDPVKLRLLANWLDMQDDKVGNTRRDVQDDLRRWADLADSALKEGK